MSVRRATAAAVAILTIAVACAPGDETTVPNPDVVVPSGATPSPGILGLPLGEAVDGFLEDPFEVAATLLADRFGETDDVGYVPHLVDLLRVGTSNELAVRAGEGLQRLTGVERPEDHREAYLTYGTWLETHDIEPADGYLEWKRKLLGDIDTRFEELLAHVEDPLLAARLQWGGVVVGGIPELNDPDVLQPAQADFMTDDETVFGVEVDGEARAYPLRILGHHELANDHLGGTPVAMTFCTLCRAAITFDRRVDGQLLTFETSGLLIRSNKVMVDEETGTLWEQLSGEALAGPLEGRQLDRYLVTTTSWREWLDQHPDTDVLDIPEQELPSDDRPFSGGYSYEPGDAYKSYYGTDELWFPGLDTPDVLPQKAEVLTFEDAGEAIAIAIAGLERRGPSVVPFADGWLAAVPTPGGGRLYHGTGDRPARLPDDLTPTEDELSLPDGTTLARAEHGQAFWFAWYARHPDTRVWPG